MIDYIIIAVVVLIVGGIAYYLYRSKKHGNACVGCPYSKQCGGNCSGNHIDADKI